MEAAAVGDAARAEVRDRPAALGDVHPQAPVLVALLLGLAAPPAVDLLEPVAAEDGGDGVLVGVGDAVGVEPLRAPRAAPRGRRTRAGRRRRPPRPAMASRRSAISDSTPGSTRSSPSSGTTSGAVVSASPIMREWATPPFCSLRMTRTPSSSSCVERVDGGPVARGVVDDDDLDRLRLPDRVDGIGDERTLLMAGHDHRQSGLRARVPERARVEPLLSAPRPGKIADAGARALDFRPARARSSVGERSLHTREVAGSKPAAPMQV